MTFPVYVNLSDRATGHVVMSMISYRMRVKYWPNNFRKDAHLARNYVSRGAGFFFVDGRVGAVDTIKLLGADFHGKIPKHYNLPVGSAQSNDQLQDLPPDDLAVADCFLPVPASSIGGTQPSVGPGQYAVPKFVVAVTPPAPGRKDASIQIKKPAASRRSADTTRSTVFPSQRRLPPLQSLEPQPVERPNIATHEPRQASSPPKGGSSRLSKVSKKALFEESKAIKEEVRTRMARLEELDRQLGPDPAPMSARKKHQRQREAAPAPSSSPPQRVLPQTTSFHPINEPGPSVHPDHRRSSTQTFNSVSPRSPGMPTGHDNQDEGDGEKEAALPEDDLYADSPRPSPPEG